LNNSTQERLENQYSLKHKGLKN